MRRSGRRWAGAAIVVGFLATAACADDGPTADVDPSEAPADEGVAPSSRSSPFTVGPVPGGYEPLVAGVGTQQPWWLSDCCTPDEPTTVLSPDGAGDHPDVVAVSFTPNEYPDEWTADDPPTFDDADDPDDGIVGVAGRHPGWDRLTLVLSPSVMVRVASPEATREELEAVLDGVDLTVPATGPGAGPAEAPAVDPPEGYRRVGAVSTDGIVAVQAGASAGVDQVPGPPSAHGAAWLAGTGDDQDGLSVVTLPGDRADLAALDVALAQRWWGLHEVRLVEVDGRRAAIIDHRNAEGERGGISAWVETGWGDIAIASGSAARHDEDGLLALAASVTQATDEEWDAFLADMGAGAEVRADPDRTELLRGEHDGTPWLLQTGGTWDAVDALAGGVPDPCLKIAGGRRACTSGRSGRVHVADGQEEANGWSFLILSDETLDAAAVRVTTADEVVTEPTTRHPDGSMVLAVVFAAPLGLPSCSQPPRAATPSNLVTSHRLELLDADGAVVGCLGI